MDSETAQSIVDASIRHAKPQGAQFAYGTAGFRMLATKLDSVVFSVGLLAALRSKKLGRTIGVMITASHNPPEDNGVKVVDPLGEMLEQSWEKYATLLANADSGTSLVVALEQIAELEQIDLRAPAKVVIGRDSRDSGLALTRSAVDALACAGAEVSDFGLLTTPQLHYLTRTFNDAAFGRSDESGYLEKLSKSFKEHYELLGARESAIQITVDAANGIGADKITKLQPYLHGQVNFDLINGAFDKPETLNVECGADFVKTNQRLPKGVSDPVPGQLYCSFDGDADRIVFYYVDAATKFHLLDGDKIATMLALFFASALKELDTDLQIGIVQTAYANGSSTEYIAQQLKVPVECTATGVKHLHHKAQQFDVGVYFEANGHGTVLFSDKFIAYVNSHALEHPNVAKLKTLVDLINQTVGDAISDLLAVLVVLAGLKLSPADWDQAYTDLPNKLAKVVVKDRTEFTTTDAERRLVTPAGLQAEIDAIVKTYPKGRSFVRASGTEDAVRVYAEACTREECDRLSAQVVALVQKYA